MYPRATIAERLRLKSSRVNRMLVWCTRQDTDRSGKSALLHVDALRVVMSFFRLFFEKSTDKTSTCSTSH